MKKMKSLKMSFIKKQKGLTLIEALVALVILALGVLGLAGVQTRLLVESRTTNSRALAIGLIDDLSNRMLLNRDAAIGKPISPTNATLVPSAYTLAWSGDPAAAADPTDCRDNANQCTGAQLATYDLMAWRRAVAVVFPGGQATVFNSANDQRQIGIAIAWPENERKLGTTADDDLAKSQMSINAASGITCPNTLICHFVYVQP
jgi:type IV pilus assembly protein PilV